MRYAGIDWKVSKIDSRLTHRDSVGPGSDQGIYVFLKLPGHINNPVFETTP